MYGCPPNLLQGIHKPVIQWREKAMLEKGKLLSKEAEKINLQILIKEYRRFERAANTFVANVFA